MLECICVACQSPLLLETYPIDLSTTSQMKGLSSTIHFLLFGAVSDISEAIAALFFIGLAI